jgi:hypothetical protein
MGCTNSKATAVEIAETEVPETFPKEVTVARKFYCNWANATLANHVLTAEPKNEEEVLLAVNWAADNGWTVRAVGIKHNWSPITIVDQGADKNLNKVLLITLMPHMNKVLEVKPAEGDHPAFARVQLGINQITFLSELEKAAGGNGDIGFGLTHTPAPDSITVGGMLAIDGHGTAVPTEEEAKHINPNTATYGSYSNRMLACRAVVYDEATQKYVIREFKRANGTEIAPFLAHVGRAFLTEATLQVEPNYYMRCQSFMNIDWKDMFPAPVDPKHPQEHSMAWHLRHSGRAEAIWFPFTDKPWLKVWTVTDGHKPTASRKVDGPCNYPFSDDLGPNITKYFRSFVGADDDKKDHLIQQIVADEKARLGDKSEAAKKCYGSELLSMIDHACTEATDSVIEVLGGPKQTPVISSLVWVRAATGLLADHSDDIWGPSKNTLIYVRDTTLRVTANGYAVMTNLDNVQQCMYVFVQIYREMIEKYAKEGKYPIACPLEIRVTGLDDPTPIGGPTMDAAVTPPLSALGYDEEAKKNNWNACLWLDVLSLPGATHSNEFYAEMETAMLANPSYKGTNGRIRPEWSKGWGYTKEGPWRSGEFAEHTRNAIPEWDATIEALDKHDAKKLFTNPWMTDFFVKRGHADANKVVAPSQAPKSQLPPDPAPEYAKAEGKSVPQEPTKKDEPKKKEEPKKEETKKEEPKKEEPVPENKPAAETKPAETAKPAEETKPAEAAKPVEENKPAEAAKPVEETKPVEAAKPAEEAKPVEAAKPAEVAATA